MLFPLSQCLVPYRESMNLSWIQFINICIEVFLKSTITLRQKNNQGYLKSPPVMSQPSKTSLYFIADDQSSNFSHKTVTRLKVTLIHLIISIDKIKISYSNCKVPGSCSNWSPKTNDDNQWIQIEFDKLFKITGIRTQGRNAENNSWITSYRVSHSRDGLHWNTYRINNGTEKVNDFVFSYCQ